MLTKLFKKKFTNANFLKEILAERPNEEWLLEATKSGLVNINHKDKNKNTFLMNSLKKGNYKSAVWLIKNNANPSILDSNNKNAIDIAIEKNKIVVVDELLKTNKININQIDEYGRSLLQNIIVTGNFIMAKALIKGGANINTLDNKGKHILYDALSYGDHSFVRHLLTYKNIELNDIDKEGNTLMQHPQIEQDDNLAKDLIIAGSNPSIRNVKGESYLYKTALRGSEANDIIDLCLLYGADVNALTTTDNSIMMELVLRASEKIDKPVYRKSLLNIVSKMIEYKGNINALNAFGESGLFNAVEKRDIELIVFLLKANIDANIQNKRGETVLELLVYTGMEHSVIINLLLEKGINPKLKNKKGQTIYSILTNLILHKEGNLELEDKAILSLFDKDAMYINLVQLLLDHEKVPEGKSFIFEDILDNMGNPLFFKPLMNDNFALFNVYTKHKINIHQLNKQKYNIFFAYVNRVFEDNIDTTERCKNFKNNLSSLISRKIDKEFKDSLGWTILHKVVSTNCNLKLFKILTDVVKFDYSIGDNLGRTVIHNAVWQNNIDIIKEVHYKSNQVINIEDIYGITPIYYAALLGSKSLVMQFFDLGAKITTKGDLNPKAIKKFKPMLKNLLKLKEDIDDVSLIKKINSLTGEIVLKFR